MNTFIPISLNKILFNINFEDVDYKIALEGMG